MYYVIWLPNSREWNKNHSDDTNKCLGLYLSDANNTNSLYQVKVEMGRKNSRVIPNLQKKSSGEKKQIQTVNWHIETLEIKSRTQYCVLKDSIPILLKPVIFLVNVSTLVQH